jgi:hypothetical protein
MQDFSHAVPPVAGERAWILVLLGQTKMYQERRVKYMVVRRGGNKTLVTRESESG